MGKLCFQSCFAVGVEEISARLADTKAAHPELSVLVMAVLAERLVRPVAGSWG